ncbi:MAG: hypothetical protein WAT19_07795 [Ferruginibacter sp.]
MKSTVKNTALFVFMALAAMPLLVAAWFVVMSSLIIRQMEEKLENSLLTEIQIPANKVTWLKAGKEILANNEPFDIKSCELINGVYHFKGLYDKKEKALKKALTDQQHETGKNIYRLIFAGLYYLETTPQATEQNFTIIKETWHSLNSFILSAHKEPRDHPPQLHS